MTRIDTRNMTAGQLARYRDELESEWQSAYEENPYSDTCETIAQDIEYVTCKLQACRRNDGQ